LLDGKASQRVGLEGAGDADNDQPVPQNLRTEGFAVLARDEHKHSCQNEDEKLSQ
jgi:hypothetical protein